MLQDPDLECSCAMGLLRESYTMNWIRRRLGSRARVVSRHRILVNSLVGLSGSIGAFACGDGATEPPPSEPPQPTTVTATPASAVLSALGETVQLTAVVRDQNGQAMTGAVLTWLSSATSVATVEVAGLVTAAGNGAATITAAAGSVSSTAAVTVAQEVSTVAVSSPADALLEGDTLRLSGEASDANGHAVAGADFTWASEDTLVAVVDGAGLVTGITAGNVVVTATSSGVSGPAELIVLAPAPTTIAVMPDTVMVTAIGQSTQLAARVMDQAGRAMEGAVVSWSSGDTTVAVVDSAGLVTAVAAGSATVAAAAGEARGESVVTVMQSVSSVVVSPTAGAIGPGDTLRLVAEAFDENGHPVDAAVFSWSSSDGSIATVDATGLVRGVREGQVMITAAAGDAQGTAKVTVDNQATTIAIDAYSDFTRKGNWTRCGGAVSDCYEIYEVTADTIPFWSGLTLWATVRDQRGDTVDATIEWRMLDSLVYQVEEDQHTARFRTGWRKRAMLSVSRRPTDPMWARIEASMARDDATVLADTITVLLLAEMGRIADFDQLDLPIHVEVGGTGRIDFNVLYQSPRGLPMTYVARFAPGGEGQTEPAGEYEMRDGVLHITGANHGVDGFAIGVRTELEYTGLGWPRAVYVGRIPCREYGEPRASADARFRIELDFAEGPQLASCVTSLIDGAVGWWERALAETDLSGSESCGAASGTLAISIEVKRLRSFVGGAASPMCIDEVAREGIMLLQESIYLGRKQDTLFHSPNIGSMYNTVRHEIGHVLGIGASGQWVDLITDHQFRGENAVAAYASYGGEGAGVPLADRDRSHWNELLLSNELMTPNGGSDSVVSRITLGALADLGWVVDMTVAEPYTLPRQSYADGPESCLNRYSWCAFGGLPPLHADHDLRDLPLAGLSPDNTAGDYKADSRALAIASAGLDDVESPSASEDS